MKYLIILLFVFTSAQACDREAQPFARFALGHTSNFSGEDPDTNGLAAQIELGVRFPVDRNWVLDFKYGHDSWLLEHGDADDARDHINFGLEYQFR